MAGILAARLKLPNSRELESLLKSKRSFSTLGNEIEKTSGGHLSPFERIRKVNQAGNEYWESSDLAEILEYTRCRNFEAVIAKAKLACFNSGHRIEDHFADVSKMTALGSVADIPIVAALLSRFACYVYLFRPRQCVKQLQDNSLRGV